MTDREPVLRAVLERWKADPIAFVRECFHAEPDAWQAEALAAFPHQQRLCLKACKGPGKTAVLAWCVWNFLLTRPLSLVGATSITATNLADNLWAELSRWRDRSPVITRAFEWSKTRIENTEYPDTWFATARAWPKQADEQAQANTLAGLHADFVLFVLDESGGIPQAVMTTAEAVLATGREMKVLQAGNPTHTTGPLHRACTTDRHLWTVVRVTGDPDDPQRSPRISLKWAKAEIARFGRDNPWVMVNVLGEFPPASINALLGVEDVERAMRRNPPKDAWSWAQRRLGVDAARFGDDPWVLFARQGFMAWRPQVLRAPRTTEVAARIQQIASTWKPEFVFFDETGHWGHGAFDLCEAAGLPMVPVIYSAPATSKRYKNVRSEMYVAMAEWVRKGGALPKDPELVAELTEPTYTFVGGQFVLEDKDHVKARLGRSPNKADALAQTFAFAEQPGEVMDRLRDGGHAVTEIDDDAAGGGRAEMEFNPFAGGVER
jgi:phage terminase large subunit